MTVWENRYPRTFGQRYLQNQRSGAFVNCLLETISPALFHPAFPIQPPPLRGTSFHRKEGVSTLAPSLGRGCRAQRGGVGFFFCGEAASSLLSPREEGFVRRYSFSTYACIRFDFMGKAVFSYRSLPYLGRLFLYYVALRSFDSVLIFSDKPFFNTRRFSPLRMTKCAAPPPLNPLNPLPLCHSQSRDGTPRGLTCHPQP